MDELLTLLSTTEYISGEKLCLQLSMTRAAVWKRMEKLRAEGYLIQSAGKRGYRLEPVPDNLLPAYVTKELATQWAGRGDIFYQTSVSSTNTLLKDAARMGAPKGSLYLCELQTEGKGRLQRSWDARQGENLLQSLLLCPKLPVEQAPLCTLAAAIAMAQAIEDVVPGLQAGIKWPNDIVINGKKCVGILSELSADMDGIQFIVMGVGVNVNQTAFPEALRHKATSLLLEAKNSEEKSVDRRKLLCAYLLRIERAMDALETGGLSALLPEYSRRSVTLQAQVQVIEANDTWIGYGEAIDETGALLVRNAAGTLRRVLSGDVSVRGVMGYVDT